MSDADPSQPLPLIELREVLAVDLPLAFDGLHWWKEDDVYFVEFPAARADGTIDIYLTKWTFVFIPGSHRT